MHPRFLCLLPVLRFPLDRPAQRGQYEIPTELHDETAASGTIPNSNSVSKWMQDVSGRAVSESEPWTFCGIRRTFRSARISIVADCR